MTGSTDKNQSRKRPSRLAKAIELATALVAEKGDIAMAAKRLDIALLWDEEADPAELARALELRIELAVAMGDTGRVAEFQTQLDRVSNSPE